MKRVLFVAVALALATPAFSQTTTVTEYYVVQDTGTKKCTIVEKKPTEATIADVPRFELPIPPLRDQHGIATVLGALDDKIDLNRRMNETLETMARALRGSRSCPRR